MNAGAGLVIRPVRGPAYWARRRRGLWFLPLALIGLVRQFSVALLVAVVAIAVVLGGVTELFFSRTSISLSGETLRKTGYLGRTRTFALAQVAAVLEVSAVPTRWTGPPTAWLLVLDAGNRTLFRAVVDYYPADALAELRQALPVPWEALPTPRTYKELRRELPGSFPWGFVHLWGLTMVLTVVGIVLISLAVIALR